MVSLSTRSRISRSSSCLDDFWVTGRVPFYQFLFVARDSLRSHLLRVLFFLSGRQHQFRRGVGGRRPSGFQPGTRILPIFAHICSLCCELECLSCILLSGDRENFLVRKLVLQTVSPKGKTSDHDQYPTSLCQQHTRTQNDSPCPIHHEIEATTSRAFRNTRRRTKFGALEHVIKNSVYDEGPVGCGHDGLHASTHDPARFGILVEGRDKRCGLECLRGGTPQTKSDHFKASSPTGIHCRDGLPKSPLVFPRKSRSRLQWFP